jgi:dethiobiotin synthetase
MGTSSPEPPELGGRPRGVFVTGTGTEVGKSVVAAVIAHAAAESGRAVRAFKPAVSGLDEYPPAEPEQASWRDAPRLPDHLLLRLAADSEQSEDQVAPYRYGPPLSPHLAAELAGEEIDPARLLAAARAGAGGGYLVCEGVGGFLVPLTRDYLVRDFAGDLGLPVVVVAEPGLGTINHTLLTIEAVRGAGLEVATVVLNPWPGEAGALERDNRETISRLGAVEVKALPQLDLTRPESWPAL